MFLLDAFETFVAKRTQILYSNRQYIATVTNPEEGYLFQGKPEDTLELAMLSAKKCLLPNFLSDICCRADGRIGIIQEVIVGQSANISDYLIGTNVNNLADCPHQIIEINLDRQSFPANHQDRHKVCP